jgi:hypothetical protein
MSGRVMRRMKGDQVAFANWAENLLPKRAKRAAFHLDRQALGTGTGIIGRISAPRTRRTTVSPPPSASRASLAPRS